MDSVKLVYAYSIRYWARKFLLLKDACEPAQTLNEGVFSVCMPMMGHTVNIIIKYVTY